jgi:hypothetical protein
MCIIAVAWHVLPVDFCEQRIASMGSYGQLIMAEHVLPSFFYILLQIIQIGVFYDFALKLPVLSGTMAAQ